MQFMLQKANAIELHEAWERYMEATEQWNEAEAARQAKTEIKVKYLCFISFFIYSED